MRKASVLMAAACATLLWGSTAQAAATPEQKCQEAKLKAQGKYQKCIKKNAAGIIAGKPDKSADCQSKFTLALGKADAAAAKKSAACRYLDNGDGTVSDLNTGLVWEQKDVSCPGPHCYSTTYTWSTGSPYNPTGTAFTSFLYGLNGGTSSDGTDTVTACFTGHCDWRLPTVQELAGIVDLTATGCGSGSPCIDPVFGPTQAYNYWSATTGSSGSDFAWIVSFYNGFTLNASKTFFYYVRAVRGGL
jgi:hypothetical protein